MLDCAPVGDKVLGANVCQSILSYRRDDSAAFAGRLHDRLEREFGRDLLFMDVDSVPLGENFARVLDEAVAKCDVLLAIIGPNWLDARDEDGRRRLEDPNDFVRLEIASALRRRIPVVPVLLEGARVAKAGQLPDDVKELVLRNGLGVRHASFHNDMDKLIRWLKDRAGQTQPPAIEPTIAPVLPQQAPRPPSLVNAQPDSRAPPRAPAPSKRKSDPQTLGEVIRRRWLQFILEVSGLGLMMFGIMGADGSWSAMSSIGVVLMAVGVLLFFYEDNS